MNPKRRITIHTNKTLHIELIIYEFILLIGIPLIVLVANKGNLIENIFAVDPAGCLFVVLCFICGAIIYILAAPTISTKIVITNEGAKLSRPFRKSVYHPWDFYTNCEKAYYLYYGMPSYYIVLSNFKLKTDELCHINGMEMNDRCIRIKYNKKNFDALMQMLPPKFAVQLENQFKDIKAPKINFIP